jgi:hypothetical protein
MGSLAAAWASGSKGQSGASSAGSKSKQQLQSRMKESPQQCCSKECPQMLIMVMQGRVLIPLDVQCHQLALRRASSS